MVKQGIDMKTVYFVDGNLADYSKDFPKPGTLDGAKGTLPGRGGRRRRSRTSCSPSTRS